ncbi:hypothetical protein CONLIGDRAFT_313030 [Coniochaeta ligniaria NRRL 30616]|uniref:Uncharacterized protein n=1 Tax=Coniochaeta ligniaria NRRL 30616 TaxID=1408157 RepID=A0A1J7IVZ7_9PEZI|nr:hypothetical protein CONLIGDRAFT_313030 [Coniochaeta ligniaria NRRL 30616]
MAIFSVKYLTLSCRTRTSCWFAFLLPPQSLLRSTLLTKKEREFQSCSSLSPSSSDQSTPSRNKYLGNTASDAIQHIRHRPSMLSLQRTVC